LLTLLRVVCLLLCLGFAAQQKPAAPDLELVVSELMKGKAGSVAVLDVVSGKLIASWNLKLAAQRLAAPGSTVKPFVLDELLRTGKIRAEQRLVCRRPLYIEGRRMDCSHSPAVTDLDAAEAIAYSCNSYFAAVATQLRPQELEDTYRRAGLASLTQLAPSELTGHIRIASSTGQLQLQALGDWGIEVTPLELVSAYRILALQKRHNETDRSAPVFIGLEHSVQYGMAHSAQPAGITAAGKTGTAAGRGTAHTHAFFAGYAPAEKPEIVLVVYLENGFGADAAAIAAPIFTTYAKHTHSGANGAAR